MMRKYQPQSLEKKWKEVWQKEGLYQFKFDERKKKFYVLVELPYTSGDLHIGHWFTFVTPDVVARFRRMNGDNVFFPIGYDAFGLPAENAAIKRSVHPYDWTMKNIKNMTKQFSFMGAMINNWEKVVITCLPEYYRFNQWIFLKMYERGLIYRRQALSNWCPSCQTVLANENVVGNRCWRCDTQVEQRQVPQWFIKITAYAQRLIWPEKPAVDWPQSVRVGQNNWIGQSEGTAVNFKLENGVDFWVYTTRLDTIFGASFLVIAPEKVNLEKHTIVDKRPEVTRYLKQALSKSELERKEGRVKTGVFTGLYGVNPVNGEKIPLYISDYVLGGYGTGMIMAVPSHDERDFQFAKKFNLPVKPVIVQDQKSTDVEINRPMVEDGFLVNSGQFNGLSSAEARKKILAFLKKKNLAKKLVTYHLHDWSISRQRYWGTPVPMIHCPDCGIVPVPYDDLPVELPYEVDFTPKGKPPLATNEKWLKVSCPKCGREAKRDPETLDTFFDSAWYWFRYLSPDYQEGPFDKEKATQLTPVDIYFGGAEHTLGHTLYARFFTKFFHDLGLLDYEEFALKRVQHGIVLGPDGEKMSKSKGNVINPDEQVAEYGTDAVRLYLCFIMPYESTGPWSDEAMAGVFRFLKRVWEIYHRFADLSSSSDLSEDKKLVVKLYKTIEKVTADIQRIKLNTAVAAMMEFLNEWEKNPNGLSKENAKKFLQLLAPFAPFITEEIWREVFGEKQSIHLSTWPKGEKVTDEEIIIPVQVNGKFRSTIRVKSENLTDKKYLERKAREDEKVKKYLVGKKYKVIYVPGKILNFVTY